MRPDTKVDILIVATCCLISFFLVLIGFITDRWTAITPTAVQNTILIGEDLDRTEFGEFLTQHRPNLRTSSPVGTIDSEPHVSRGLGFSKKSQTDEAEFVNKGEDLEISHSSPENSSCASKIGHSKKLPESVKRRDLSLSTSSFNEFHSAPSEVSLETKPVKKETRVFRSHSAPLP